MSSSVAHSKTSASYAVAWRSAFSACAAAPLHIFEPRYREMLKHALAHHRMFCVALLKPHCVEWNSTADFFQIATVGLIRACVERKRRHIEPGFCRDWSVSIQRFPAGSAIPIATIESLESDPPRLWKPKHWLRKVLELYSNLKGDGLRQLPPR